MLPPQYQIGETIIWTVQSYAKQIHCDWLLFTKKGGVKSCILLFGTVIIHLMFSFLQQQSYCHGSHGLVQLSRRFLTMTCRLCFLQFHVRVDRQQDNIVWHTNNIVNCSRTTTSYVVIYTCLCFLFKYALLVLKKKLYHCEKLAELYTLLTTLSIMVEVKSHCDCLVFSQQHFVHLQLCCTV